LLNRWLATLVKLEQNCFSPFVILTFCSTEFIKFLIGYSPPSRHIRTFQVGRLQAAQPVAVQDSKHDTELCMLARVHTTRPTCGAEHTAHTIMCRSSSCWWSYLTQPSTSPSSSMHCTSCSSQAAHPTCVRRGKSHSDEDEPRHGASPRRNTVIAYPYARLARSMSIVPYYCLLLVNPMAAVHLCLLLVLLPLPT
jgi:hypothetical protein